MNKNKDIIVVLHITAPRAKVSEQWVEDFIRGALRQEARSYRKEDPLREIEPGRIQVFFP